MNLIVKILQFFIRVNAFQTWCNLKLQKNVVSKSNYFVLDKPFIANQTQKKQIKTPIKTIAFYLPQFHSIPENDEWWGKGFTEWTNVTSGKPLFNGHYQPHEPTDLLGYYNLEQDQILNKQIELAKLYGITGFCFYFYWFSAKRLLEKPLLNFLNNTTLDFPFCLCWANENWTRRWDGLDNEILISQNYSAEDDIAFITYVSKYLIDRRYIRINGRPLLIVYRPSLLPSMMQTTERWRHWCRTNGVGEIHLAYTQSFEIVNPAKYGFDSAIEFPPNLGFAPSMRAKVTNVNKKYTGNIFDWQIFMQRSNRYSKKNYKLFRTVVPSWDNTARRKFQATIFARSNPQDYKLWLIRAIRNTVANYTNQNEQLIFINAWNEWAEGAHLEPDKKYGFAYLEATREALRVTQPVLSAQKLVVVAHDAHPHGAQLLLLYIIKNLSQEFNYSIYLILLTGGKLVSDYEQFAQVHIVDNLCGKFKLSKFINSLYKDGYRRALFNTTVSGELTPMFRAKGFYICSLIHELPEVINNNGLQKQVSLIAKHSDKIVFPADEVKNGYLNFTKICSDKIIIKPQGLFRQNNFIDRKDLSARDILLKQFKLENDAKLVLSIGYADHRKGVDLFVEIANIMCKEESNVCFIWVGHFDKSIKDQIYKTIHEYNLTDRIFFVGMDFDTDKYYAGSDVYALTSREDPFPSVILEAMEVGLPIVAFDGAGGFNSLFEDARCPLVPMYNIEKFAVCIRELLTNQSRVNLISKSSSDIIKTQFSFHNYLNELIQLFETNILKVSVVIPNYNYSKYLKRRIQSILNQTYPIWEIIFLDDASTDNSIDIARPILEGVAIQTLIDVNEFNSGNTFVQWQKGISLSTGDYIWIAEADDFAKPEFLENVLRSFKDPEVVLSYCDSIQVNSEDKVISKNYQKYYSHLSKTKWNNDYLNPGIDEITSSLAIKNTIPNVSAVVFNKKALRNVFNGHSESIVNLKIAGDWLTYILILKNGKIAYNHLSLNYHNRHSESRTLSTFDASQLIEILTVQKYTHDNFNLNNEIAYAALNYSQKLYEMFKISDTYDSISKNPDLFPYLSNISNNDQTL